MPPQRVQAGLLTSLENPVWTDSTSIKTPQPERGNTNKATREEKDNYPKPESMHTPSCEVIPPTTHSFINMYE